MTIASLDIKGAYDGVNHQFLFERVEKWRQWGFMDKETVGYLKFLYNQYKIGLVEPKNGKFNQVCLVNVGVPQGSRLSCNAFNGVQDAILQRT